MNTEWREYTDHVNEKFEHFVAQLEQHKTPPPHVMTNVQYMQYLIDLESE